MPVINNNISTIQNNTNLVKIVSGHVILSQSRNVLKGNCPFHQDISASFMISPAKNIFKCFGCGKEGGPAEFATLIGNKAPKKS
jgi:DNA primase